MSKLRILSAFCDVYLTVSLDYNISMKSLVLWLLVLGAQTLLTENYSKGLCMTAKRSQCGPSDRAVSVKTKDNLIMYCNECEACRMHDVRSCWRRVSLISVTWRGAKSWGANGDEEEAIISENDRSNKQTAVSLARWFCFILFFWWGVLFNCLAKFMEWENNYLSQTNIVWISNL